MIVGTLQCLVLMKLIGEFVISPGAWKHGKMVFLLCAEKGCGIKRGVNHLVGTRVVGVLVA